MTNSSTRRFLAALMIIGLHPVAFAQVPNERWPDDLSVWDEGVPNIYDADYLPLLVEILSQSNITGQVEASVSEVVTRTSIARFCLLNGKDRLTIKSSETARFTAEGLAHLDYLISRCGLRVLARREAGVLKIVVLADVGPVGLDSRKAVYRDENTEAVLFGVDRLTFRAPLSLLPSAYRP